MQVPDRAGAPATSACPTILVVGARGIPDVEGGAEKNAERLFPLVAARGFRVVLMGLANAIGGREFRGVELRKAPTSRLFRTDKLLYYVTALFTAFRLRPRIVHLQGLGAALFLWAYKLMGLQVVVRYGSADYLVGKWGPIGRAGFRLSEFQLRFADAVIAVAPALAERLKRRGIEGNVVLIPNAVDDSNNDAATATPPPGTYVLTVGRVTAQKNIAHLLMGFSLLPHDIGQTLLVVGGLDDAEYVKQLQPLLSERAVLAGRAPRSAMTPLYANCSVFVNASIHEGCSNAVLEAISAGCPILLSDIPENRDLHLPDHIYFDPHDPRAIAAALSNAIANPHLYIVDRGQFPTWDDIATRTIAVYEHLLAPRTGKVPSTTSAIPPVRIH